MIPTYLINSMCKCLILVLYNMHRFRFENMIPQWNTLSNGLWSNVEQEIQNKLESKPASHRVMIITGTIETCKLFNKEEIFLASNNKIPVPMHIWKMYYSINKKYNNIVYLGINNPSIDITIPIYKCRNICGNKFKSNDQIYSTNSGRNTMARGFSTVYCCSIPEFLTAYGNLNENATKVFQQL